MTGSEDKTFWEHLDDLRTLIVRILCVVGVAVVVCFCFKETLFGVVLAPSHEDFFLYQLLSGIAQPSLPSGLINTGLAGQLMTHFKVAAGAGIVVSAPIVVYMVARYVAPALYPGERRALRFAFGWGTMLFLLGMFVAYSLVFPLAFQFLANYEVADEVTNMFTLDSYIDNLLLLCLLMGVLFELPIVAIILSKLGLVTSALMKKYRRHAILAIVTVAAIITPTTDIFTLTLVSLPVYLLYEVSVHLVK